MSEAPIGAIFARLTVVGFAGRDRHNHPRWVCKCECGGDLIASAYSIRRGLTKSCGCLKRERTAAMGRANRTHGMRRSPEWDVWSSMRNRCLNPRAQAYALYGGRGIKVCDRWKESFEAFLADMGPRPSPDHSLDRIDNDGDYEPGNCRWACRLTQGNNRRTSRYLTHGGRTQTLMEWSRETGLGYSTIRERLRRGWDVSAALTTPPVDPTSSRRGCRGRLARCQDRPAQHHEQRGHER